MNVFPPIIAIYYLNGTVPLLPMINSPIQNDKQLFLHLFGPRMIRLWNSLNNAALNDPNMKLCNPSELCILCI